jgi:hypothetical protein
MVHDEIINNLKEHFERKSHVAQMRVEGFEVIKREINQSLKLISMSSFRDIQPEYPQFVAKTMPDDEVVFQSYEKVNTNRSQGENNFFQKINLPFKGQPIKKVFSKLTQWPQVSFSFYHFKDIQDFSSEHFFFNFDSPKKPKQFLKQVLRRNIDVQTIGQCQTPIIVNNNVNNKIK